jgi:hypothetical protein
LEGSSTALARWTEDGADRLLLATPGMGLGLFDGAGLARPGWPLLDLPLDGSGVAVAPDGVAAFIDQDNNLRVVGPDGVLLWSWTPGPEEPLRGSPVFDPVSGGLYATTEFSLFALAAPSAPGASPVLWSWSAPVDLTLSPTLAVGDTDLFVYTSDGMVHAIPR